MYILFQEENLSFLIDKRRKLEQNTVMLKVPRLFPSSNKWGVPDLLLEYQASEIPLPFRLWGEQRQAEEMLGTYAFYVNDVQFNAMRRYPERALASGCNVFAECNFSTSSIQPTAIGLYDIWWKRYISRVWQESRKKILVDMHVDESLGEYSLLGVPHGWGAYVTRGMSGCEELLDIQYERAVARCGNDPEIFIVYAGGIRIQQHCIDQGWYWFPNRKQRFYGR